MGDLGGEGDLDLGGEGDLDLGGEGDLDLGGEELGGEGEGADTALLATPGRVDDNPKKNLHQGGPHIPTPGGDNRRSGRSGPNSRIIKTLHKNEAAGFSNRAKRPQGWIPKISSADVRFGLEEQQQPTYTDDETVLFKNTTRVRRLVEAMERKEDKKDET